MKEVKEIKITKVGTYKKELLGDLVVMEEPLEIRISYGRIEKRQKISLVVTMRTPGKDGDLALGFLLTEGIVKCFEEILKIKYVETSDKKSKENILLLELSPETYFDVDKLQRHFYTTSSCGVCGKASIETVHISCDLELIANQPIFSKEMIFSLPELLRNRQSIFSQTGGLHAATLVNKNGEFVLLREDVGRHNAVDKLIGVALRKGLLPLFDYMILVSGRASFELVQKSMMAGIPILAAVGAPSSLAVELAEESGMTLIGFLKKNKMNIYTFPERIKY